MNFKKLAEQKIDELSGKTSKKVVENDSVELVLEGLDEELSLENTDETFELDLDEDSELEFFSEQSKKEQVENLFDGYLGEQREVPNPLEYGPNATYRNLREGVVYKKGQDNLWEVFIKDGQNGKQGQSSPGGGCGVTEVNQIALNVFNANIGSGAVGSQYFKTGADSWVNASWITSAQTSANPDVVWGKYLTTANVETVAAGYAISTKIPISGGQVFIWCNTEGTVIPAGRGCYYDSNGNFVTNISAVFAQNKHMYYVPVGVNIAYMRLNFQTPSSTYKYYLGIVRSSPKVLPFEKISFDGDSILAGAGGNYDFAIPKFVGDLLSCSIENNSLGGRRMSGGSGMWSTIQNTDMNSSCVVLMGGVNDFLNSVNLGSISSTNTNEFYGALNSACGYMVSARPWQKFYLCTPLRQGTNTSSNTSGFYMEDYSHAIISAGTRYGVTVLDLYDGFGIDPKNSQQAYTYTSDGLHYNWIGNRIAASYITKRLLTE